MTPRTPAAIDQAGADLKIAQARAEERRAMAQAHEQEMQAQVVDNESAGEGSQSRGLARDHGIVHRKGRRIVFAQFYHLYAVLAKK